MASQTHTDHNLGDLNSRWAELIESEGQMRTRDAAARLEVSELELTTSRLSESAILLSEAGLPLLKALEDVGPMMALTRNESAVIEKVGR
ncbi:MAG: ChuX/HutX family heme-like substrate-binding protein, partial [Myxococcota bacterium]|nr:ChuX/HutX family heme-like substrate-binding protein [Myxococcota bacterium]